MPENIQHSYLDQITGKRESGIPDFMMDFRRKYMAHATEFQHIFGRRLFDFWDNITGFDVIKFDEQFIKPDEGQSTQDAVRGKYGDIAVELIHKLL